jgi:hypothetical protein
MSLSGERSTAARSSALLTALAGCALLAGCMHMNENECRSANWYQVGYRDADIYGLRPQIDQYAYLCRAFGVAAAQAPYMAGWVDGYREWNTRVMGSECCGSR